MKLRVSRYDLAVVSSESEGSIVNVRSMYGEELG